MMSFEQVRLIQLPKVADKRGTGMPFVGRKSLS